MSAPTKASKHAAEIVEEMKPFIVDDPHKRHYALERLSGRIEGELAEAEARGAERMKERCKAEAHTWNAPLSFVNALAALPLEEGND